jgi:uncharacterized membrane protein
MKPQPLAEDPNPPYQPRSFWKKVDSESAWYFLILGMVAGTLFAFIAHGFLMILGEVLEQQVLFQLIAGVVALVLCLIWVISKVFQEIERIDEST